MSPGVGVVIATKDRPSSLARTLDRLLALPERPPIVVVDDGSRSGPPAVPADERVTLLALPASRGAAARTAGVRALDTPIVAFADDDSWWAPGALARLGEHFAAHPRLGLTCARVLVGAEQRLDPVCELMAASPLHEPDLPGPGVLGFVACGAAVRREAYLAAGGFHALLGVGGEEELLALDLAAAGWGLAYVDDVVAHHHPEPGERPGRRVRLLRNRLLVAWLRRSAPAAARQTADVLAEARGAGLLVPTLAAAARIAPRALRDRRRLPARIESDCERVAAVTA